MKELFLVIFLLVNIYSPFSAFLAPLVNLIFAIFFIVRNNFKISLSKLDRTVIFLSLIILIWTLIVCLINGTFSSYTIGRFARILFNTILIVIVIHKIDIKLKQFLNLLAIVLFINTVAVYLQILLPQTKMIFAPLANYSKYFFDIRAFGLYASYDATGLNSCLGLILWGLLYKNYKRNIYLILYLATFASTVFISRTSMVIAILISLVNVPSFFKTLKARIVYFTPIIIGFFYYFFTNAYQIFISTFFQSNQEISTSYYSGSQDKLVNDMIFFPKTFLLTLIGIGDEPKASDIGYIKLIFMIGLIGLILILATYAYSYLLIKRKYDLIKFEKPTNVKILYKFTIILLVLMFIFNVKLLLLYGRGFHDLYIILLAVTYYSLEKMKDSVLLK